MDGNETINVQLGDGAKPLNRLGSAPTTVESVLPPQTIAAPPGPPSTTMSLDQYLEIKEMVKKAVHSKQVKDPNALAQKMMVYEHGLRNLIPDFLKEFHDHFVLINDPEYQKFKELQNRFGDT